MGASSTRAATATTEAADEILAGHPDLQPALRAGTEAMVVAAMARLGPH